MTRKNGTKPADPVRRPHRATVVIPAEYMPAIREIAASEDRPVAATLRRLVLVGLIVYRADPETWGRKIMRGGQSNAS